MAGRTETKTLKVNLLELVKPSSDGLSLQHLLAHLKTAASKRSVQRCLNNLIEEKIIYRIGKGPSTRYCILRMLNESSLGHASQKVINFVSQPLAVRPPVSYRRVLLDKYKPNATEYLEQSTKILLHQIGKTSDQIKPAGTFGREILNRLLIDLSWASSKLEGNTYSRLDTQRLLEYGQSVAGKDAIETQMILNHKDAISFLVEDIERIAINRHTLLNLHGLLSDGLLPNPEDRGRIRARPVDISGTTYKPLAIPQMIDECFDLLLYKATQIKDPFEQAFFLMVHLPYLQAFIDVNKRVSRLAVNIPLLKNNLCPLTFIGMPEQTYIQANIGIYELNDVALLKDVFVLTYERSVQEYLAVHQSLVAPDPLRLKNRKHIQELVHLIVKRRDKNVSGTIDAYARIHIDESEQSLFKQFVLKELERLHEGVLASYRLNETDFKRWKKSAT